jgi:peroxiredoxin
VLLDTPICDFGWKALAFSLADAQGRIYTLDDVMDEKGLLVAFICNHCPYVQTIIDRLVADARALQAQNVGVVAIMSNDYNAYAADNPENMALFATEHDMSFPYLIDETQEVGKAYEAVCTPDFFGFNADGELQYRGRLDDVKMGSGTGERRAELLDAMTQVAESGQGPQQQNPSMGCSIKWRV